MPGVSGQFFRNFGLTVVIAVLVSLTVARMITPMLAAYFLKSHGTAEHASGKWMDRYLGVLHWSLDAERAKALRARIARVRGSALTYLVGTVAVLLIVAAFMSGLIGTFKLVAASKFTLFGWAKTLQLLTLIAALIAAVGLSWLVRKVLGLLIGLSRGRLGQWYA